MTEIRVFPVWLRLLCSIFLLGVSLVRSEQLNTIEGQVFIRTNSGETIKLSLVTVLFFDEKTFSADLQKKREDALKVEEYYDPLKVIAQDSYNSELTKDKESREARDAANFLREIKAKADYTRSAKYLLGNLPQPLQSIKTDADGKFTFKATSGSYVLVAATNRATGARAVGSQAFPITESYY